MMLLHAVFDKQLNMVFNSCMITDKELIRSLGGPARVAEILKFDKSHGGVQRVQNWLTRGIPAQIKVDFPELFMRKKTELPEHTKVVATHA